MKKRVELLAPGGDVKAVKAAIVAGADAVYFGLDRFNARNRAENIDFEQMKGLLHLAHKHQCKLFLTLNILILQSEFKSLWNLLNRLVNTTLDGLIVQDIGLFHLLKSRFPTLEVHASTQCTTHNRGQLSFLKKLGAERVNLCRELSVNEIGLITKEAHKLRMEVEVFIHGSNCIAISGLCYMSSQQKGTSGNRGRCGQPCRDAYEVTAKGVEYPLNLKDKSAWNVLQNLCETGVDSLKVEGRIKQFHYVYQVIKSWRSQLDAYYNNAPLSNSQEELYKVFNRDFSQGYLDGTIPNDMFINNPRDHSALARLFHIESPTASDLDQAKGAIYNERTGIISEAEERINQHSCKPIPLTLSFSGTVGAPLKIRVEADDLDLELLSKSMLKRVTSKSKSISEKILLDRFSALSQTAFKLENLTVEEETKDLQIPFRELAQLKTELITALNEGKAPLAEVPLPQLSFSNNNREAALSILLSYSPDVKAIKGKRTCVSLPSEFENLEIAIETFKNDPLLTPWFPPLLIGEQYEQAVRFLKEIQPSLIVTENSGIAFAAQELSIPWIAGPQLNSVNSYTLKALQDEFNCRGAFLSNELNLKQLGGIQAPQDFELHYSILHPTTLMTSRQCFFHQLSGCHKSGIDEFCIGNCNRQESLTDLKGRKSIVEKSTGNYQRLFNSLHYMNLEVVTTFPHKFDSFLLDLRDIPTDTTHPEKEKTIELFEAFTGGNHSLEEIIKKEIQPTECQQFKKGI